MNFITVKRLDSMITFSLQSESVGFNSAIVLIVDKNRFDFCFMNFAVTVFLWEDYYIVCVSTDSVVFFPSI